MFRRARYNPFAFEAFPHRARAWDRYSQLVWERRLPAGTDLRAEFGSLQTYWREQGWTVEEPYLLSVFMSKGEDRWNLTISKERA